MSARRTQVLLVALIALVAVLGAYLVGTGRPPRDPGAQGVVTYGKGSITATPDEVAFTVTVTHTEDDTAAAMDRTGKGVKAVVAALEENGVAEDDIRTASISVDALYDYTRAGRVFRGYQSRQTIKVRARDLDKAGDVMRAAIEADENAVSLSNVSLEVGKKADAMADARTKAITSARKAARALADAAGQDVGEAVFIDEVSSAGGSYRYPVDGQALSATLRNSSADSAGGLPIQPGEQQVSVEVKVRWSLD